MRAASKGWAACVETLLDSRAQPRQRDEVRPLRAPVVRSLHRMQSISPRCAASQGDVSLMARRIWRTCRTRAGRRSTVPALAAGRSAALCSSAAAPKPKPRTRCAVAPQRESPIAAWRPCCRRWAVLGATNAPAKPHSLLQRGESALHVAVSEGRAGCAEVLIANGADVNARATARLLPCEPRFCSPGRPMWVVLSF